jgi:hypothetical protein
MIYFFRFFITTLFLILVYIIYRSEIYYEGSERVFYLIYFIGTLLAILFLIIITYLKVKIQKYIIIIFISIAFTLYSFEGKLIFDQKKTFNETDLGFDRRTKYEVYENLKKTNSNVTVTLGPNAFLSLNDLDLLNLAGISKIKTIHCNENGYYSIYQSDRYGFNNPDKEWNNKRIDYLLVGDSFTHGACVNRPNDIASVLRQHSKKNVLNLGFGGNGPLIEYATLREYLPLNIKNVLWIYFEDNDLTDLKKELKNNILNKYLIDQEFKQNLKFKQAQIDQFITTIVEREIEKGRERNNFDNIKQFIKLNNIRSFLNPQLTPTPPPEFKIILNLAKKLVESHNGEFYFIYLPSFDRYAKFFKMDSKQQIKKIVNDLGIEFIDLDEEVFKKEKNPLKLFPFEKHGHYNVEGYNKIAVKIYEKTK